MVGRDRKKHQAASLDEVSARRGRAAPSRSGRGGPESNSYSIMQNTFRVDSRYSGLRAIGKGSFGIVCSALDATQGKRVAIKKIHPMASHVVDAKHVLREIRLMRYLGVHPNIVSLEDLFVSEYHDELYIVMELLDSDLHRIIQSPQPLGDAHHRYFMFQLLKGVKFLHDNRIIHRDLKPGNILVTKNCQLRITDFGLARLRPMGRGADPDDEVDHPMTEHVVTRWYRPPELMLCPDGLYGYAVDLWSIGCIFAELLGRKPLFPGKTFMDQLSLIFDILGSPKPHEVAHIRNSQAKRFLDSKRDRIKVPFGELLQSASEQALDLLEGLLVFDPPRRLSVHEALEHPYFQPLRKTDTSPRLEVPSAFEFEFESNPLCRLQLKAMILDEVESFQVEQRKRHQRASPSSAIANPASASADVAGEDGYRGEDKSETSDQKQQQRQQKLQKQEDHQWMKNRSEQEALAPARSSACGPEAVGKRDEWERRLERAPISAVSSAQAASEAVNEHADVFESSRGHAAADPAAVGEQDLEEASETEPMDDGDDGGSSTPNPIGEDAALSPGNLPCTPEFQRRRYVCAGVKRSGSKGGRSTMASSAVYKRWSDREILPSCNAMTGHQPRHHAQVQAPYYAAVDRSHRLLRDGDAARDLTRTLGSSDHDQRESNGGAVNHRPWAAQWGQALGRGHGGKDRDGRRGRGHPGATGRYRVPRPFQDKQFQGQKQLMQLQEQQHWGKKTAGVHDVEDRFYRLNYERARQGLPIYGDVSEPSAGMRAPQR